jgi:uncharacterized protein (DUF885 family)
LAPASLAELTASCFDLRWQIDPVAASAAGLQEHDHRLGAFGVDEVRAQVAALTSFGSALEELNAGSLDDEIDRTALLYDTRIAVHRYTKEKPHVVNPGFWLNHVLEGLHLLLALRDRPREHRARAAAARLAALPGFLDAAQATLKACPAVFVTTAIDIVRAGLGLIGDVAKELELPDDPGFPAAVARAQAALQAFERFLDKLRDAPGGEYAIGEEAFHFRLRYEHALRDSADELWRYGHRLAEEVEREVEALGRQIDPSVDWPDLVHRLREDHPHAGDLVAAYAAEMERARAFVAERKLTRIPAGALDVIATPSFLRPLIPFAAYQPPGAFSRDRTGLFYVTQPPRDRNAERILRDHCRHELASTALHEGYPGHHLQFLHALGLPRPVRRVVGTALTIEGWALYCEEMMGDEGFYRSLEERFFQRVHLLWRAWRIVLDVGLHTRGMTVDEAIRVLTDRVHFEPENAAAEVHRYCATPGYQLCYAVGRRELRALRESWRAARGADASLADFHAAVLSYGGLPVSLIRWGMGLGDA